MTGKPAVAFVSEKSKTGKTTLLTAVLKCLKERGYCVGTIKHCGHEVRPEGQDKDSGRHVDAGSDVTVVAGPGITTVLRRIEFPEILAEASKGTDIVLVEGYKGSSLPKIEVFRSGRSGKLMCREKGNRVKGIIAVASDVALDIDETVLPLNKPESVCDFIEKRFGLDRTGKTDENDMHTA